MAFSLVSHPGSLWKQTVDTAVEAFARGALQPVGTRLEIVTQAGIDFQVRVLVAVEHKLRATLQRNEASRRRRREPDPFQPWEKELYVADISPSHVCLLNKFNVFDHHLLIVTRTFEPQVSPLTARDFEATWRCLAEYEGLAFYNAGKAAGASQEHRHLQMVPLPLPGTGTGLPLDPWVTDSVSTAGMSESPRLPYRHAIGGVDPEWIRDPVRGGSQTLALYEEMLRRTGLSLKAPGGQARLPPYNLLLTRKWILFVPRRERGADFPDLNALGFAGALLARDVRECSAIRKLGPLEVLRRAGLRPSVSPDG